MPWIESAVPTSRSARDTSLARETCWGILGWTSRRMATSRLVAAHPRGLRGCNGSYPLWTLSLGLILSALALASGTPLLPYALWEENDRAPARVDGALPSFLSGNAFARQSCGAFGDVGPQTSPRIDRFEGLFDCLGQLAVFYFERNQSVTFSNRMLRTQRFKVKRHSHFASRKADAHPVTRCGRPTPLISRPRIKPGAMRLGPLTQQR